MNQDSWLRAHVALFEAFGGSVPRIVPDNLKTGVTRHPAEGEIVRNDAYRHMASHYSAAVLPGRVRKPKDKASVENTVGHIATWVIAGLRHSSYTSLNELRQAIRERVHAYNAQPFQKRAGSRTTVFQEQERPLLRPLPAVPYAISSWVYGRKVAKNSYISYKRNYYSVPVAHLGASVDLRVTDTVLEIFHGQQRLSSHLLRASISTKQMIRISQQNTASPNGIRNESGIGRSGAESRLWKWSTGSLLRFRFRSKGSIRHWQCCV